MGIIVKRGIKNAFRNTVRTFSIVLILGLSIGLALTMLIARSAVESKIASVNASIGNIISVAPAGMRGFEGGGDALTEDQMNQVAKLDHVSSIVKTLNDRLTSDKTNLISSIELGNLGKRFNENNGSINAPKIMINGASGSDLSNFKMPVTLIGTTSANDLAATQGGGSFTLKSGNIFNGNSAENIALVGASMATKNNLNVGSTFTAYGKSIKVIGIFDAGNEFSNGQVIMPLLAVQSLSGQAGAISGATVNVDSISNIDSVTTAVKNTLGDKADITNSAERAKEAIAPLENIRSISAVSLIGSLVAGAVIILLTMMMIVRERRKEIGVLKAIGATNIKVMAQFIVEAITLTVLGTLLGLAVGVFGSNPVTKLLVQNSAGNSFQATGTARGAGRMMMVAGQGMNNIRNIQAVVGWNIILYGLAAALIIAVVGSAIPAWFISKVRPAEVMRAE